MINVSDKKIEKRLLVIFLLGFILIFSAFWRWLAFPTDYRLFETSGKIILQPNEALSQLFQAKENNLSQIQIILRDENMPWGENLTLSIRDENCKEVIRSARVDWPLHAPKQYDYFTFPAISDSKDETYCLHLLFEAPKKRKYMPYVLTMEGTGNTKDQILEWKKSGTQKEYNEQSFVFHPTYKTKSAETLSEFARRLSAYKASYFQGNVSLWIIVIFLLATLLLVGLVILL
ncbi:MAG: hypothetical protein WCO05_02050 [Candidatus Moraniibacteriota bacterium]|jgi:hypothetical protein